jgi:hypothetical protein
LFITALGPTVFGQGALTPPGAPAPTMKTLTQVEPRTDVLTLPGDASSLHAITQSGSYYLTTNILGTVGGSICGISIEADNVTLDLKGFALLGNGDNWSGIWVTAGTRTNVVIMNGTVSGWGNAGVYCDVGAQMRFEGLALNSNKNATLGGLYAPNVTECQVKDSRAANNGGHGFWCGNNAQISSSVAAYNGHHGIYCGSCCLITGCTSCSNLVQGIQVADGCYVEKNLCCGNNGTGINATGEDNRIDSNHAMLNALGIAVVLNGHNLVVRNSAECANYYTQPYSLPAGNCWGPLVDLSAGQIASATGWENFQYYTLP